MSRPSWARGLKLIERACAFAALQSRPSWARGLKRNDNARHRQAECVAPLVGAWVETRPTKHPFPNLKSRPSWARGLKPA